jgi:putative transposase
MSLSQRREWIDAQDGGVSVAGQCRLLGLARSGIYYQPVAESAESLVLMRLLDEEYTRHPFYGVRRMTWFLRQAGYEANPKRVRRLLRRLGLEALYPKPRLSLGDGRAGRFPYLLGQRKIERADQAWCTDLTYIRLKDGFIYLTVILDWHTRYVISWRLSDRLEGSFCLEALEESLARRRPEIFNNDQGTQFTSEEFVGRLQAAGVRVSWDGRGRVFDNIFVERFWRTVKYEDVYLREYRTLAEARTGLGRYIEFYNWQRPHSALENQPPAVVYYGCEQKRAGKGTVGNAGSAAFSGSKLCLN